MSAFVTRILILGILFTFLHPCIKAQELNCQIEVNADMVEQSNRSVFETLKADIADYMNTRQWGSAQYAPGERIECRLTLTVKEYSSDRVKGDLQVQLIRPVYNTTYTTTVFNFRDAKIDFSYREGDRLVFNEQAMESNLTAILNFYAYMILALDSDTFAPEGGEEYYKKAAVVVQQAQSSGETGWRTFEDNRNRSALLQTFTDKNTSGLRNLLYSYHRRGLDEMAASPDKGRSNITASLKELTRIKDVAPMSVGLTLFRDSKLDELVNVYSKAPASEKEAVFKLLSPIYPADGSRLRKIKEQAD